MKSRICYRGKHITQRTLDLHTGREGPAHDPYGYTEYTVHQNGKAITLHAGLMVYLEVDGKTVLEPNRMRGKTTACEAHIFDTFEKLTGFDPQSFEKHYWRIHGNDMEDPMGCAADYE